MCDAGLRCILVDIVDKSQSSGIMVLHLPTAAIVGKLEYKSSVDEIFDIQILPGVKRPGILNTEDEIYRLSLSTPESTYWAKNLEEDE